MWASIHTVERPATLEQANALALGEGATLFAGGSYLAAAKQEEFHTLVDIHTLLSCDVDAGEDAVRMGAGATLQQIVDAFRDREDVLQLAACARWSCPSKMVRNQRTIGGEIARERLDSELVVLLHALQTTLLVTADEEIRVPIGDWDGLGIITGVEISRNGLRSVEVQRFALIDSAPAFVIAAGVLRGENARFVAGGKTEALSHMEAREGAMNEARLTAFAIEAANYYPSDAVGSQTYKKAVLRTALKRIRGAW